MHSGSHAVKQYTNQVSRVVGIPIMVASVNRGGTIPWANLWPFRANVNRHLISWPCTYCVYRSYSSTLNLDQLSLSTVYHRWIWLANTRLVPSRICSTRWQHYKTLTDVTGEGWDCPWGGILYKRVDVLTSVAWPPGVALWVETAGNLVLWKSANDEIYKWSYTSGKEGGGHSLKCWVFMYIYNVRRDKTILYITCARQTLRTCVFLVTCFVFV